MHFVLIIAVLLATTLAEKAPAEAVSHTATRTALALFSMLLAPALAATMSAIVLRGLRRDIHSWAEWVARFSWGQQLHAGILVIMVGLISYVLAWPQVVRVNMGLGDWILIDDLLILAPVYIPLMLSWAAFYDVDKAVHDLTAEDEEPAHGPQRCEYVLLHARHYLGLILAPLLLVLVVYDTARWLSPQFATGPYSWLLMTPLLIVLVVAMPQLIATLWKTQPLPVGTLRTHLTKVVADCRLRVREIFIWQTNGRMTNAAVSGLLPHLRYVFLTDRLVETLGEEEVAAVVRHEAGHVIRHHLWLRMACLGMPLAVWLCASQATPHAISQVSAGLGWLGISPHWQECALLPAMIALYAFWGLGGFCKLLEFEADLFACGLLYRRDNVRSTDESDAFVSALYKITAGSAQSRRRSGWLHPSITCRVRLIRQVQRDHLLAVRLQRRIGLLQWGIGITYICSAVLGLLSLGQ